MTDVFYPGIDGPWPKRVMPDGSPIKLDHVAEPFGCVPDKLPESFGEWNRTTPQAHPHPHLSATTVERWMAWSAATARFCDRQRAAGRLARLVLKEMDWPEKPRDGKDTLVVEGAVEQMLAEARKVLGE